MWTDFAGRIQVEFRWHSGGLTSEETSKIPEDFQQKIHWKSTGIHLKLSKKIRTNFPAEFKRNSGSIPPEYQWNYGGIPSEIPLAFRCFYSGKASEIPVEFRRNFNKKFTGNLPETAQFPPENSDVLRNYE